MDTVFDYIAKLKQDWTDRYVTPDAERFPELKRFEGKVGRVVTVNHSGRAIVDFADGAWYDIPADEQHLRLVTDPALTAKFDVKRNSAQSHPDRQG